MKIIKEKIKLLKNNPRIILLWFYKISNLIQKNVLNSGERYDPNIMKIFNINDEEQKARYNFANNLIPEGADIIDIACGTGYGSSILSSKERIVTGVDISDKSIKFAKKHYQNQRIRFIASDIFSFSEKADYVVSFETIEHVPRLIKETLNHLISLTNKLLICSVPYQEKKGANKHHIHFEITEKDFSALSKSGKVEFLYQTKDGQINKINDEKNTNTLIIIFTRP